MSMTPQLTYHMVKFILLSKRSSSRSCRRRSTRRALCSMSRDISSRSLTGGGVPGVVFSRAITACFHLDVGNRARNMNMNTGSLSHMPLPWLPSSRDVR